MHSLADMAAKLNRSTVYLSGLQKRFELPAFEGATYPDAYLEYFRTVVYLRTFGVSEETLRDLWSLEKKLLTLLHVDSTGSPRRLPTPCHCSPATFHRHPLSSPRPRHLLPPACPKSKDQTPRPPSLSRLLIYSNFDRTQNSNFENYTTP
jgi:hypothetical protein